VLQLVRHAPIGTVYHIISARTLMAEASDWCRTSNGCRIFLGAADERQMRAVAGPGRQADIRRARCKSSAVAGLSGCGFVTVGVYRPSDCH
jgi:hypothetical protein